MKRLAIIPARCGSKGLKDKNIVDLCGKPLIAYSIEAAIKTNLFTHIIVSTDSEQYANISHQYGAEVRMRPAELASDTASSFMVIKDVLDAYCEDLDYFVLLQPTSPLRTYQHVCEAINFFENNIENFDFLVSVKRAEFGKDLVNIIDNDNSLKYFDKDFSKYRRQAFDYYSPNGAIFIAKPKEYMRQGHFFGKKAIAYRMSDEDSIDIDYQVDLDLASIIMKRKNG